MFQEKMAGGSNDPDDLIVRAFKAYEVEGKIEAEMFRHALMNFGDKFSQAEVDDIFGEFEVDDDGFVESKAVIGLFVAGGGEEKKEEKKEEEAAAAPAEAEAAPEDGGAKKKKIRRRPLSKYNTTSSQTNNQHITKKTPHEPLKKKSFILFTSLSFLLSFKITSC